MCKLCQEKPVYEFTNKRKLCRRCFVNYFEKKFLYTIRKFGMIKRGDVIEYKKENRFKGVVLEEMLKFFSKKSGIEIVKLPSRRAKKIAVDSSLDFEAEEILNALINGKAGDLRKNLPAEGKIIKPLYLFSDAEIMLYAKLKKLKFKEMKEKRSIIKIFEDEFEKKHPEVKRAAVKSLLELYNLK
jgi:hypothetical protein